MVIYVYIFFWYISFKYIYIYIIYIHALCICPCPCPLPCQGTKAACKPQLSHKGRFSSSGISGSNSKCTKYTGSAWVAKRVSSLPDEEKIWFMAFWTGRGWCVCFFGGDLGALLVVVLLKLGWAGWEEEERGRLATKSFNKVTWEEISSNTGNLERSKSTISKNITTRNVRSFGDSHLSPGGDQVLKFSFVLLTHVMSTSRGKNKRTSNQLLLNGMYGFGSFWFSTQNTLR